MSSKLTSLDAAVSQNCSLGWYQEFPTKSANASPGYCSERSSKRRAHQSPFLQRGQGGIDWVLAGIDGPGQGHPTTTTKRKATSMVALRFLTTTLIQTMSCFSGAGGATIVGNNQHAAASPGGQAWGGGGAHRLRPQTRNVRLAEAITRGAGKAPKASMSVSVKRHASNRNCCP